MVIMRLKIINFLLFTVFLICGCQTRNNPFEEIVINSSSPNSGTVLVNLNNMPFNWDEMLFFPQEFPLDQIEQMTGKRPKDYGSFCFFFKDGIVVHSEAWYLVDLYADTGLIKRNPPKGWIYSDNLISVKKSNPIIYVESRSGVNQNTVLYHVFAINGAVTKEK